MAPTTESDSPYADRDRRARIAEVRKAIGSDRDVVNWFEAIVKKGAFERADIMREIGLSAGTYKNARRRLDFILLQLPTATRDSVMSAFTN